MTSWDHPFDDEVSLILVYAKWSDKVVLVVVTDMMH